MTNKLQQPKRKLSVFTIILAVIASILVSLLVCLGLMLLIYSLDGSSRSDTFSSGDAVVLTLILALTLGPTLIAAAVVALLLKKRRKN